MSENSKAVVIQAGIKVTDAAKFIDICADVIANTRKESGCVRYDLFQSVDDKNVFYFLEEYVDEAAFQAHRDMPYMAPFRKARETVLEKYLGVDKFEK